MDSMNVAFNLGSEEDLLHLKTSYSGEETGDNGTVPKAPHQLKKKYNFLASSELNRKEWSEVVRKIESECTYDVTVDAERIKEAVRPEHLGYVLRALKLEAIPEDSPSDHQQPTRQEEDRELLRRWSDEGEALRKSDLVLEEEDREFRRTVCVSVCRKIGEKPTISPYKTELSVEETASELSLGSDSRSTRSPTAPSRPKSSGLEVQPPSPKIGPERDVLVDHRSPYQKFFSRPKSEIESHLHRHTKKQVHSEKDKLFIDFMNFLDSPEIQLKSENITLDSLKSLFNIQIENPAAHAFTSDTVELSKIPKEISEIYEDVQVSGRASLHRQIIWDMMYEKGTERKVAFGKSVPDPRPHWFKDTKKKWLVSDHIPWDLVSGRDLWKDLLNTEILEGFAKWLVANPQYDRPKYLEKIGYFNSLPKENLHEDAVAVSLKKKRCGEAFYALANNMKYFVGDNVLSYLPDLDQLREVLEGTNQVPGDVN